MNNKQKGDLYENFIYQELLNDSTKIWLWNDIPEKNLLESGLAHDLNKHRLIRKENKKEFEETKINPVIDTGIDLLQLKDSEYILIQCKNYTGTIQVKDLAGFYMMIANHYDKKSEVYYTSSLSRVIKENSINKKIKYHRKPLKSEKSTREIKQIELYEYQKTAVNEIKKYYQNHTRGILQMPCGTGKTVIGAEFAKSFDYIVIISPLIQFSEQNLERFENMIPGTESILINSEGIRDYSILKDQLSKKYTNSILLSLTYASIDILNKILDQLNLEKSIFIVDEFHNLSKNNLLNKDDEMYKFLNNKKLKILFQSATPRIYDLENSDDDNDFENIFGSHAYHMNWSEAIKNNYITDYKIYLPSVSEDKTKIIKNIEKELSASNIDLSKVDNTLKAKCIYLYKCLTYYGTKKCIVYLQSSEEINQFIKTFKTLDEYYAIDYQIDDITYTDNKRSREKKLKEFTEFNGFSILCSVHILDECIDIPSCDSIYLTYNSNSKIRNIQRLCRSVRKDKNKPFKVAKIYVWCNEYDKLPDFLSSIKEYDPELKDKVRIQQSEYNQINKKKVDLSKDQETVKNYVINVMEYKRRSFEERYDELVKWVEKNKRIPNSKAKNMNEKYIGIWCSNVRSYYRINKISYPTERVKKFEKIPGWYWNYHKKNFEERFKELTEFVNKNDHLPKQNNNKDEKSLNEWIRSKKQQYKDKNISEDQIKKLETVKHWTWDLEIVQKTIKIEFDENLENLKKWLKDHNNVYPLRTSKNETEKKLAQWMSGQRRSKQLKRITKEKEDELDSLPGWTWNSKETGFKDRFEEVKKWVQQNNKIPSHGSKDSVEKPLGSWCTQKRMDYKNNKLSKNQIKDLESIKNWVWNISENALDNKCSELIEWIKKNNRFPKFNNVGQTEKNLYRWASQKKNRYKRGLLSDEDIKTLENIPGWKWSNNDKDDFDEKFKKLKDWNQKHNIIPSSKNTSDTTELELFKWINKIRIEYKINKLSDERIKKLEALSGWKWVNNQISIDDRKIQLTNWINKNNKLPSHGSKDPEEKLLGGWCQSKRIDYKNKKLSDSEIKDIEQIPKWVWDPKTDFFKTKCEETLEWVKKNKKMPAYSSKDPIVKNLGQWCSSIKKRQKQGSLTDDEIKSVEKIPGWKWSSSKTKT